METFFFFDHTPGEGIPSPPYLPPPPSCSLPWSQSNKRFETLDLGPPWLVKKTCKNARAGGQVQSRQKIKNTRKRHTVAGFWCITALCLTWEYPLEMCP